MWQERNLPLNPNLCYDNPTRKLKETGDTQEKQMKYTFILPNWKKKKKERYIHKNKTTTFSKGFCQLSEGSCSYLWFLLSCPWDPTCPLHYCLQCHRRPAEPAWPCWSCPPWTRPDGREKHLVRSRQMNRASVKVGQSICYQLLSPSCLDSLCML